MGEPVLDTSNYKNFKGEGAPDNFHHVAWKTMKYEEMIVKGNTVPEGKKPISGFEAVMNMKKSLSKLLANIERE